MSGKPKRTFSIIVALTALVVLLVWWQRRPVQPTVELPHSAQPLAAPTAATPLPSSAAAVPNPTMGEGLKAEEKREAKLLATFQTLNHNPIEFYGRVVDQYGEPVVGASVQGDLLYDTGNKSGVNKASTTTDAQGYFQFKDLRGESLGIGIAKNGYEYQRKNSFFSYSYFEADHKRHIPDPRNPVIFTLWKKQGAEALVHYNKTFWEIPADGTPVKIDLATGKISANGNMVITLSRTPLKMQSGEAGYAWQTGIQIVDGGLVRVGERQYYNLAPETGYEPRFEYAQSAWNEHNAQEGQTNKAWQRDFSDNFYISSRNGGNFARLSLHIMANVDRKDGDNIGSAEITIWLNPNGSRNLEFDPAKAIMPPR